jgi:hypothetical protein
VTPSIHGPGQSRSPSPSGCRDGPWFTRRQRRPPRTPRPARCPTPSGPARKFDNHSAAPTTDAKARDGNNCLGPSSFSHRRVVRIRSRARQPDAETIGFNRQNRPPLCTRLSAPATPRIALSRGPPSSQTDVVPGRCSHLPRSAPHARVEQHLHEVERGFCLFDGLRPLAETDGAAALAKARARPGVRRDSERGRLGAAGTALPLVARASFASPRRATARSLLSVVT